MDRHRLLTVYLSILAVWMQFIAPVAMANARPSTDSFSVICGHHQTQSDDSSNPLRKSSVHDCCTLCQAQLGALAIDDRPVLTGFLYPAESLLGWRITAISPRAGPDLRHHRPRGPPSLV